MRKHKFRITVEHIEDAHGAPLSETPLVFHVENHDDILALARRIGTEGDKGFAFLLGLKLLGETLLDDKTNPLYQDFRPHFGEFVKRLKQRRQGEA